MGLRIKNWINNIIHIGRYKYETETKLSNALLRIEQLERELSDIYDRNFTRLLSDQTKMRQLNLQLSATPTVWGDEKKLFISENAAVDACFFNTNSGTIKIGEYTFAGSGASIIAGAHDPKLSGFLRRDVEYKSGCDIEIGKGVWIAANAVILGPCIIEDNAVIAAGAVVVPNTHIHKGELYGGIPARKIKTIDLVENLTTNQEKLNELVKSERGVLFFEGWTEKKLIERDGTLFYGHWLEDVAGVIYIYGNKKLLLFSENQEPTKITIIFENGEKKIIKVEYDLTEVEIQEGCLEPQKIIIESPQKIFVAKEGGEL